MTVLAETSSDLPENRKTRDISGIDVQLTCDLFCGLFYDAVNFQSIYVASNGRMTDEY
jgi:hypothetical protein